MRHRTISTLALLCSFKSPGRNAEHSAISMSQITWPDLAGRAGFAHGGEVMKTMDTAAGVVSVRHSHRDLMNRVARAIVLSRNGNGWQ